MRDWLAAIRLPLGFTETFAKTMRADSNRHDHQTERDVEKQRKVIDARIARLQELFELGHITRGDYVARREALTAEAAALRPTGPKPEVVADTIASLVDDWPRMDAGQKRQVLETVFVDVTIEDGALSAATPRAGWLPYLESLLGTRVSVRDERRRRESNPR
ncbi:MAG TPA: hypothetical protein VGS01_07735 [Candidatus Limnocylindria bacterium]|nr:hypothetical protein [Candidatus Limnocylindria bacterium]